MNDESTTRILIVDDEPQILRFLSTSLAAHGYSVIEASSGEEGLIRSERDKPDLIVLDLGLPDVDGTEVLQRTRAISSPTPNGLVT